MSPSRRRRRVVPSWLFALAAGFAVGIIGLPAGAVETPVGSRNFTAPRYVPNYFSNEAGAFTGAAGPHGGQPGAPVDAAPRAYPGYSYGYAAAAHRSGHHPGHYRGHAASRPRSRHLAHGRAGAHRRFVQVAAHGRPRQSLHTRPAAAHHGAVRSRARSTGGTRRVARAGH